MHIRVCAYHMSIALALAYHMCISYVHIINTLNTHHSHKAMIKQTLYNLRTCLTCIIHLTNNWFQLLICPHLCCLSYHAIISSSVNDVTGIRFLHSSVWWWWSSSCIIDVENCDDIVDDIVLDILGDSARRRIAIIVCQWRLEMEDFSMQIIYNYFLYSALNESTVK